MTQDYLAWAAGTPFLRTDILTHVTQEVLFVEIPSTPDSVNEMQGDSGGSGIVVRRPHEHKPTVGSRYEMMCAQRGFQP